MDNIQLQLRRDTTAHWIAVNPVLAMGEPGIETDFLRRMKIGDGVTAWNALPVFADVSSLIGQGKLVNAGMSPYAVQAGDSMLYVDTSAGNVVLTPPAAPSDNRTIIVKKVSSDGNTFTFQRNTKNIEGAGNDYTSAGAPLVANTFRYDLASTSWWILSGFGPGVAGGSFDPSQQLSNLMFWSRADDLKLLDGASVNRWQNRQGTGDWLVPSFVGVAPAYKVAGPNGHGSVNFDTGGAPALWIPQPTIVPAFDPNGAITFTVVWKWTSLTGTYRRGLTVKQPNGSGCSYVCDSAGSIGSLTNSTFVGTDGANPAGAAAGVWHIATYVQTGSGGGPNVSKLWINGVQKGANNAVKGADTTGNPLGLGAFYMTGSSRPDGLTAANEKFEIAEFALFTQGLSDADRQTFEASLKARYATP